MLHRYYSPGKLLITSEYLVLRGARALALPTKLGQSLEFESNNSNTLHWIALDRYSKVWFEAKISVSNLQVSETTSQEHSFLLINLLETICKRNPTFVRNLSGIVRTKLEFDLKWGLGSSSTLVYNLSQWANVDPYFLLNQTYGGSGYDLAIAKHRKPLLFQLNSGRPISSIIEYKPKFLGGLYFIYLGKKKSSKDEVKRFRKINVLSSDILEANQITEKLLVCSELEEFSRLINEHEIMISRILNTKSLPKKLFSDFSGGLKSLGSWGGDFILASGGNTTPDYFKKRGFGIVLSFKQLIAN